ncbi:Wound-induced protein 1 [Rhynchospora pubera]|uniref:Wound-induced protein 1 n=1 Tax=Rhynchospora pubera TaxID=906938 RepID=A0AAV8EGB7_9POAL|nr:Wound-induced protein 1 [Rhynchospora pubera]KAJ4786085.1 Wound-induced protein 1 [Rhynchospora pubera]
MASGMENKNLVESLYESLAKGDTEKAAAFLAHDLDWRFHGPRMCQHMSRLLTGETGPTEFNFEPRQVVNLGEGGWVVAEGWEGDHVYWVHVWAVENGVITRFREYFNTTVTVRAVGHGQEVGCGSRGRWERHAVWQSKSCRRVSRSMPGLVLAI